MGEKRWTEMQRAAIDTRDKTLLVSAAAGSGKTATLTERIISSILDESSPESIQDMLIVTFTNAAAGELRERISGAIKAALKERPGDARLEKQLLMLPGAKISTIDSFCNEILRESAEEVGIEPNYRIADDAEAHLCATNIMDSLIEAAYRGLLPEICSPEEFDSLSDCLTDPRAEKSLGEVLLYLYEKCTSSEGGTSSLLPLAEEYASFTSPESTRFGSYAIALAKSAADYYSAALGKIAATLAATDPLYSEYFGEIGARVGLIAKMSAYEDISRALSEFECKPKPRRAAENAEAAELGIALRDRLKGEIASIRTKFFLYTTDEWCKLYRELHEKTTTLCRFLIFFEEQFSSEKRRLGICEYSDIERYAYECLYKNGEPTDYARALASRFSSVYIDEYQDVNPLQHKIFEAVSRSDNRFMVGDIKQSIYSFRSAAPDIFAEMKKSFPVLSEKDGSSASVFMSNNFRCDEEVIDFVNEVFDRMFSVLGKRIGYTPQDRLVFSKVEERVNKTPHPVSAFLIEELKREGDGGSDDEEAESKRARQAREVATLIERLVREEKKNDGSPITPSDIAVILRNAKGRADIYADAIKSRGVTARVRASRDFFLNPEILLTLSLLNTIDNPLRDIYLTALLRSPLFDFSADELVKIRKSADRDAPMFECLKEYAKGGSEKARAFLEKLVKYRDIAEGIGVDELIMRLYHETGLLALASRTGGKNNLILLYNYARTYEKGSYKGLYSFISYVNSIIAEGTEFDSENPNAEEDDSVAIITAHASKGLEFPVTILVEADSQIRNKDARQRLAFSEGFGLALPLRSADFGAIVENPARCAINHKKLRDIFEEELRILYVILTRARERLYIYGSVGESAERFLSDMRFEERCLTEYSAASLSSYLEVIFASGAHPSVTVISGENSQNAPECEELFTNSEKNAPEEVATVDERVCAELIERFGYTYPKEHLTTLPEKLSVSTLSPSLLDESGGGVLNLEPTDERISLPSFITGHRADESALRGIATHNFLQFCSLEALKSGSVEDELQRLTDGGFISKENAARVRLNEIELFRHSTLFEKMLAAKELYRELRFNCTLPAADFTEDADKKALLENETVLVQGVIDCVILTEDGSLEVVDYKTDRLTREELADPSLAKATLVKKHALQLNYYRHAVKEIFGKSPSRVCIYSLPLAMELTVD